MVCSRQSRQRAPLSDGRAAVVASRVRFCALVPFLDDDHLRNGAATADTNVALEDAPMGGKTDRCFVANISERDRDG